MIKSYRKMQGTQIEALDGVIGILKDVYFDDRNWKIQYFIVELGSWFSGNNVLVPPVLVSPFDGNSLKVQLTKAELQTCSNADSALPVSLQQRYCERKIYNKGCTTGCFMVLPILNNVKNAIWDDPHFWSCKNVSRYEIIASDGDAGSNQDILIDDSRWLIRFFVASTGPDSELREKIYDPKIVEDIDMLFKRYLIR